MIGSLLGSGFDVRVFDKVGSSRKNIQEYINDIEIIEGNFDDFSKIKEILNDVDYVYHLICTTIPETSHLNPYFDVESNLLPTINLLELIKGNSIKKIIYLSSGGTVYGTPANIPIKESHATNPINSYGIVKKAIEDYLLLYNRTFDIDVCIFRLSNPYGEKQNHKGIQGVIPVFLYKVINKEIIEVWGDGNVIRDYIHIKDVIDIMVQALSIKTPEIVYNLGSGIGTSINDILKFIKENLENDFEVNYLEARSFDVKVNVLDISNLKNRFGEKDFININDGINKLYDYIKSNINI